jgi:hypothetical protein
MARRGERRSKPAPMMQSYVFEIEAWEPYYGLHITNARHDQRPYGEFVHIKFRGRCVFPASLEERGVDFTVAGDPDMPEPPIWKQDPDWRPRCVGRLDIRPQSSSFYFSVPHGTMPFLMPAFAQGQFRYAHLWGPAPKRGESYCLSVQLCKSVDFDDL